MAINRTRWQPDTCGCVIELEWDSAQAQGSRTHTVKKLTPCAVHAGAEAHVGATLESGSVVPHEQNTRIGRMLDAAMNRLEAKLKQIDADGTIRLKDGVTLSWSYSGTGASRVLTVTFAGAGLTQSEKNQIQSAIDNAIGAGKVVIA